MANTQHKRIILALSAGGIAFAYEYVSSHFSILLSKLSQHSPFLLPELLVASICMLLCLKFLQPTVKQAPPGNILEPPKKLPPNFSETVIQDNEIERVRLARELHDDTIHRMIVLAQKIELMKFDHPNNALFKELEEASDIIDHTIDNIRVFIKELRPPYLQKMSLSDILRTLIKEKGHASDIDMRFLTKGKEYRLKEKAELMLYRLSQTALQNIILHSEATRATLELHFMDDKIKLTILDNGKGFDVTDESKLFDKGSFGLLGMKERAKICHGIFMIHSVISQGTSLIVEVPKAKNLIKDIQNK